MILKSVTGCICDSLTVDDIEEIDLPSDKIRKEVLEKIGEFLKKQLLDDHQLTNLRDSMEAYLNLEEGELKGKTIEELGGIIKSTEPGNLNYVLQFIIEPFGELTYKSKTACDCCGDYVYEYTLVV